MDKPLFLAGGAYGCIFSPYITCKGKLSNNYKFLSKIQVRNFYSYNEVHMGQKIIKRMPLEYKFFFAPAVHHCDINIKEFMHLGIDSCKIVQTQKKSPFILLKIPYIGYKSSYISYQDYIIQDINDREILMNLIDGYKHLLQALWLLSANRVEICHFDLNSTNILFSQRRMTPLIIDFGISFSIKNIEENLLKYFYIYFPKYYVWPLEVHYINMLLHKTSTPSHADIRNLCAIYVKNNIPLQQNFSNAFLAQYEELCVKVLDRYRNGTEEIIDIIDKCWYTWDNYALSIMYLQIIFYLNISFKSGIPTGSYIENSFITHFSKLLLKNIHPDANKRLNIQKTQENFELFFYNEAVNEVANYEQILEKYSFNKASLKRIVSEDKVKLQKLLDKLAETQT